MDLKLKLKETKEFIESKTSVRPKIGITLGSGLAHFSEKIKVDQVIPYTEIPHFISPTVAGHPGALILGTVNGVEVAVLQGRIHFYEGHRLSDVVYPTRALAALGVENLILTNAAGGIHESFKEGELMIITDHINLTGNNPLRGYNVDDLGPRFPDMSYTYTPDLVIKAEDTFKSLNIDYKKGVYCGVTGPSYETPAEIKYMRLIGGSAVGMSTVPEAIAARHMGLNITGISCITNLAAGMSTGELNHDEVKEVAQRVQADFCNFLEKFVSHI